MRTEVCHFEAIGLRVAGCESWYWAPLYLFYGVDSTDHLWIQIFQYRKDKSNAHPPMRRTTGGMQFGIPSEFNREEPVSKNGTFLAMSENGFVIDNGQSEKPWWCEIEGAVGTIRW